MTRPRCQQIEPNISRYYHCVTRCVRRAFLCGDDSYSGRNFDHRKNWVVERLAKLAGAFTVQVCAYAVMSNHLHVVLYIDQEAAQALSDDEILKRYGVLFASSARAARSLPENERRVFLETYRSRLGDISWFMRCLSEHIARRANREDRCRGRFWEGRFRSQALLDDAGLLACMSYVDLNPVRAGICKTLEESEFTSIRQRLRERGLSNAMDEAKESGVALMPCDGDQETQHTTPGAPPPDSAITPHPDETQMAVKAGVLPTIPLSLEDYTELLVSTGREIREDKPGILGKRAELILARLGIASQGWAATVTSFESRFSLFAGRPENLDRASHHFGLTRTRGRAWSAHVFPTGNAA